MNVPAIDIPLVEEATVERNDSLSDFDSTITFDAEAILGQMNFQAGIKTPPVVVATSTEAMSVTMDATAVNLPALTESVLEEDLKSDSELEVAVANQLLPDAIQDQDAAEIAELSPDTAVSPEPTVEAASELPVPVARVKAPTPEFGPMPEDDFD